MIRAVSIVPAILTNNKVDFREQVERINVFTRRVQIDIIEGGFAPAETLDITNVWWPRGWITDLHLMSAYPSRDIETILKLAPSLCIFHAEASEDLRPLLKTLKERGIKAGVALVQSTYPGDIKEYIDLADHVMIFAGSLGVQGGQADLMQMEKISLIRAMKPEVEIGWDGGANLSNIRALAHAGLDVINVGSAISTSENPAGMYEQMVAEIDKNGVVL